MGCKFQLKQFLRFTNELETTKILQYQKTKSDNNILDQLVAFIYILIPFLYISIAKSKNPAMAWLSMRLYNFFG